MSALDAERSASESHALRALITSAALVYGIHVGSSAEAIVHSPEPIARALMLVALIALPYAHGLVLRGMPWRKTRPALSFTIATGIQFIPMVAIGFANRGDIPVLATAALVALQGHLLARAANTRAASGALALGPVFMLVQLALQPGARWLIAFAASGVVAIAGLFFLQRRETWRETLRSPAILARARDRTAFRSRPPARPTSGLRLAAHGVFMGVVLMLLVPLLHIPLAFLPAPSIGSADAELARAEAAKTEPDGSDPAHDDSARSDARETFDQIFPSALSLEGGVATLDHELVMELSPTPPRDLGPLYMRGMVLDTIHENGVSALGRTSPTLLEDASDGRTDGWIRTDSGSNAAAGTEAPFELEVLQQALRVRDGGWSVVFAPRPVLAARLPVVEHDSGGVTVTPVSDDWFEFALRCASAPPLPPRAEARPDRRYLQLPDPSHALTTIVVLARDVTRGARNDRERVERVLSYFQRNFEYVVTASEFPGLIGVADFLELRRGHCSYYATATALMLRSLRIPTRIATGFLANDWDAERGRYVVTTRNGHAWIEVQFEGVGWIPLDSTPASARVAAFAALDEPPGLGLAALGAALWRDLVSWAETGEESFARRFARSLLDLPRALWVTLRRRPWLASAPVLAIVYVLARGRRLRSRQNDGVTAEQRTADPGESLFARIVAAFARFGPARRPAQTLREYAGELERLGSPHCEPLSFWTERFYHKRYGGESWTKGEVLEMRRFLRELRAERRA